ncbi:MULTISPECIES: helix-turn-helix domain-containing protein [unclassified Streptomyces]|uniref:PucR family transcriptional regulator n=1 Tax=unclassified Streptomyces TaxID=2593676 RepID=UPI002DDABA70|nr:MULTISPECIES: helix-turn-helix domain-containing protein [unclassified Streptomyces]WSA90708.1 helix-turn-helix domain-containing protein [Streptomyces sp. NBC_01795]WSB75032.1 helix-turn-helix domain-containing protein [Streptomyces sp. NBC_01775]WSS16688.1 helix-turn-helix domain-containing protein [Streptomyces sp. NBC_01186]WSS45506.1 helix-turn-helix domain-containing protein [Streptomyces sp. NBC_01187]
MAGAGWHGSTDEIQVLVDELAETLGRSVVVNDPLVRQVYSSRHFDDEDPVRVRAVLQRDAGAAVVAYVLGQDLQRWSGTGVLPAVPELGLLPRLCAPLRGDGEFLGTLMVIDADSSLSEAEISSIGETATTVSALLAARAAASDTARAVRERAVRALLSPDGKKRDAGLEQLQDAGFPDRGNAIVTVAEVVSETHTTAQIELALRSAQATVEASSRVPAIGSVRGNHAVFVQQHPAPASPAHLVGQSRGIQTTLRRALGPDARTAVGVGAHVVGLADARGSFRQAEVALRAARRLPQLDGVGLWDQLGEFAVLLCIPDDTPPDSPVTRGLRALWNHEAGPRLLKTLRTYLDNAGSAPRTAAALNLHRTSLYYRLRQIQEITGMDLDDGCDRLVLHLALRLEDVLPH